MEGPVEGPVERAVRAELARMPAGAAESALGASALDLARRQDAAEGREAAAIARELRAHLAELAKRFPAAAGEDELSKLRRRREMGA